MTTYTVREIYFTLQGEGVQAGRPAVFLRFAGCNLWSGREQHRATAICRFCDTQFVGTGGPGGGKYRTVDALVSAVRGAWPDSASSLQPLVVCTGGEPLLQLDCEAIDALHGAGFEIAVESNGTIAAPAGIDWLCVSPKGRAALAQTSGNELKLVYPQAEPEAQPENFESMPFEHFLLQPLDDEHRLLNTARTLDYCLSNPRWRPSLQAHKILGFD